MEDSDKPEIRIFEGITPTPSAPEAKPKPTAEDFKKFCSDLPINYEAEFVPFSKSRHAKKDAKLSDMQLNWRIKLSKVKTCFECDYSAGIGHIPGYVHQLFGEMTVEVADEIKGVCERGRCNMKHPGSSLASQIPPPPLWDILSSLASDSDVLNYSSFEDWALELGYDADSRKAEKIYQDCLKQALALRNLLGKETVEKLLELGRYY